MKTSLADLLTQKNITVPPAPEDEARFHRLEQENRMLKDQLAYFRAERASLQQRTESRTAGPVIDAEAWLQKAVTELKSGNPIDALGLLRAILMFCPGHIRAMLNLAVAYSELDMESRAMETLHTVLVLEPGNTTAIRNMDILKERANS
jgi:Tfp pilus assembly protein PilF